jgi:hypothetical protein
MIEDHTAFISAESGELQPPAVTNLLRVGLSAPQRPVDSLVERLEHPDGASWFTSALARSPVGTSGDPATTVLDGGASADELTTIKERAKTAYGIAADEDGHRVALLGYFLAISAALVHHGVRITSQPRAGLNEQLADLSIALPAPWGVFVERAALAPAPD